MKEAITKDFKCSCGCGQKIRLIQVAGKDIVDISIIQPRQKRNKFGVVLRSDDKESLKEFIDFLTQTQ